jgi:hypothetical protein
MSEKKMRPNSRINFITFFCKGHKKDALTLISNKQWAISTGARIAASDFPIVYCPLPIDYW